MDVGHGDDWVGPLSAERDGVLTRWIGLVGKVLRSRLSEAELARELGDLYTALLGGLREGGTDLDSESFGELRALLAELSGTRARQGFTPRETAITVFALKGAVAPVFEERDAAYHEYTRFSDFIDELGLFTFETYAQARDAVIVEQSDQLLELSTPVIKLWDGVLAVPLVGTLDSARTQVVMEKLLEALVETGSRHAIIDITGVPAVDTQVAQHLLKTVMAGQLMGADCIISGIRPQIAQTVVSLGIEFGDIITKATLAEALALALRRDGFQLRRTNTAGGR
ncbi:STAS domain-containing protein [Frankia sp. CNm7]|uniref:STAS domain-containing protein n=1 Tax=Frankia nepalensis TaxID=1836974 RepID=A0A937RDJ7_9ACTN|nr:STAS domain-containing protein [Frankia nepalensis]MBL7497885.1 STAS domain-containing protein [Frankia nepalensis]MBL7514382.1 STAS domain-containing protein [Frankia nepalensis]MBL7523317.1 STAS domain-containing protein [Frankia nepalensis]MBL7628460.1 STAS domain-containing protein [Frankia nepalensis]